MLPTMKMTSSSGANVQQGAAALVGREETQVGNFCVRKVPVIQTLTTFITCLLLLPVQPSLAQQPVQKTNQLKVYVHYMPWFETPDSAGSWGFHWTSNSQNPDIIVDASTGKRQIASKFYPLIGPYASGDPDVAEYHLLLMKYSGIDGVLMDWYGLNGTNPDIRSLLRNANVTISSTASYGLQFGLIVEDRFSSNSTVDSAANFAFARDNYFSRDNYIKVRDQPLVGVFGPIILKQESQWSQILVEAGQPIQFLTLWYQRDDVGRNNSDGDFAWVYQDANQTYNFTLQNFYTNRDIQLETVMGAAYPGYESFNGSTFTIPHDGGQTLDITLGLASRYQSNMDVLQLVTWNEFQEGTMLEPTLEFGYQYLRRVQQFTGVSYTDRELDIIHNLYLMRKQKSGDSGAQSQLNAASQSLADLNVDNALAILQALGLPKDQARKGNKGGLVAGLAAGLSVGVAALAVLGACCYLRWKKQRNTTWLDVHPPLSVRVPEAGYGPRPIGYELLKKATNQFTTLLGEGGSGGVYKGVMADGSLIAVKRITHRTQAGEKQFRAEVTTIGQLRHKNLVPLKGWCQDQEELLLVYEYMPNGSLDQHLYPKGDKGRSKTSLDWDTRVRIIRGVTDALCYLHRGWDQPVIHRDIKPSNVMLDANFVPRVGDFGLAVAIIDRDRSLQTVSHVAGTVGYFAPECLQDEQVGTYSDVFSFGVMVLEVVCGRKPSGRPPNDKYLVSWVWSLYIQGLEMDAVNPSIRAECKEEEAKMLLQVGLMCSFPNPSSRPSMTLVSQLLAGSVELPNLPRELPPPFSHDPTTPSALNYFAALRACDDRSGSSTGTSSNPKGWHGQSGSSFSNGSRSNPEISKDHLDESVVSQGR